jgi:hypothetical protein
VTDYQLLKYDSSLRSYLFREIWFINMDLSFD